MVEDYELVDFLREYRGHGKKKRVYESRDVFSMAMLGKFYGRVSSDDVPTLLQRCKALELISLVKNGNIRFL